MRQNDACISPDVRFCFVTDYFHLILLVSESVGYLVVSEITAILNKFDLSLYLHYQRLTTHFIGWQTYNLTPIFNTVVPIIPALRVWLNAKVDIAKLTVTFEHGLPSSAFSRYITIMMVRVALHVLCEFLLANHTNIVFTLTNSNVCSG